MTLLNYNFTKIKLLQQLSIVIVILMMEDQSNSLFLQVTLILQEMEIIFLKLLLTIHLKYSFKPLEIAQIFPQ